jgi:3D (Asp-Asp-Asp) domain-containing protein
MLLSRSLRRKVLATVLTAAVLVLVYEAAVFDSKEATRLSDPGDGLVPEPGARLVFEATAYCRGTTTASGVAVRSGIAAADPKVLPQGSVIQVTRLAPEYRGIYTVLDTGPEIQGREIDIYMWNCDEAVRFGRRRVDLTVLRLGWHQNGSAPGRR